jgi:hypothetical protein
MMLGCAPLVSAGAVATFLELVQGFGSLIHIFPQPMRQAVSPLLIEHRRHA